MRILLATDGSAQARRARDLVAGLPRAGHAVRVVGIVLPFLGEGTEQRFREQLEAEATADLKAELEAFARPLRRPGTRVGTTALAGHPADRIIAEARRWRADLIVVGSHGRGRLGRSIFGSVASQVIDHAPCTVLVARSGPVRAIVLGEDGSPSARHARGIIAGGIFGDAPVAVVSVARAIGVLSSGIAPTLRRAVREALAADFEARRLEHERLAESAARRLRARGVRATAERRDGDPVGAILAAAERHRADLIALGTRGRGGFRRLLLGSVARSVLLRARCSVLVARAPARAGPG